MPASDTESASLFSKFLDPTKHQESSLPEISAEAPNLIVAGSYTTAVSLTYLIWILLRPQNGDIKDKLLDEFTGLCLKTPAPQLGQLKYLNCAIDESSRQYGAAPGSLTRNFPSEGAKLGQYVIPGGTTVSV